MKTRRLLGQVAVTLDWETTLYIALILLALITRMWGLGDRVQSHDESLHTKFSWDLYSGRGFRHTPLMHGPFLFHATALSYFLFGDNDTTARLPVALIGVAVVAFPILLRRWLGRTGALLTSFFLLISPSIAYYSRYIRHDIPVILWFLLTLLAVFSYLREGKEHWLYVMAGGVSLMFATKEVAFIYSTILGVFLVGLFTIEALADKWLFPELKVVFLGSLAGCVVSLLAVAAGMLLRPEGQVVPAWWAILAAFLAGLALLAAVGLLLGNTWRNLRQYRSFDLALVLGTLCLPFLSPLLIQLIGQDPVNYEPPTIYYSGAITAAVALASLAIGLLWDRRRWSIVAAIHYGILVVLFTTFFTNGTGIATGVVGSLGYWLAQQEVQRGGQPWYYYLIVAPLYEYLPMALSIVACGYVGVRAALRRLCLSAPQRRFIAFVIWWVVLAWVSYSYAGEKMPWLTVHLALPMIVLSGWLVGQLLDGLSWQRLRERRGWLLALLAPPLVAAVSALVGAGLSGPFQGNQLEQLDATGRFLGGVVGALACGAGVGYLIWRTGWRVAVRLLLALALVAPVALTIRTAWRFCYVNYDYPIEHLVYAHSGPAVKEAMRQIQELSRRTAGGPNEIKVAFGADGSWPFYWYLRNFPNAVHYGTQPTREAMDAPVIIAGRDEWDEVAPFVSNDYVVNTYTYLWWPSEDYRNLTWQRLTRVVTDTERLAALGQIWYNRDYRPYDAVTGKKHSLDEWPLRNEFRLYIRREDVVQLWDLNTAQPTEMVLLDPYAEGWQDLGARLVFGSEGAGPGQLRSPRGIRAAPDGFIYVADAGNNRIQKFTTEGEFAGAWNGFTEPWDMAVAPDGTIFVADTWQHQIQMLDADGDVVAAWGTFGEYTVESSEGKGAFYGPRGVGLGPNGRLFVADTGNKRVQVFNPGGDFHRQWGGGGALEGDLDEPVGIAVGPDGFVYVADTWNRRIQVFDRVGTFVRMWQIKGWDTGIPEEKPYLALDSVGNVFVTDPGRYRVLVFDNQGNYLASFGKFGTDEYSFGLPAGIAVAADGTIYVTDAQNSRVMVFDPLFDPLGNIP